MKLSLPRASESGRLVELDGMRAVAVVAVSLFHLALAREVSWNPLRPAGGFLGVDIFFVLSGFLITTLLLAERQRSGRIDLKAFYARRALRLFPALAVLIVVVGVVSATLWSHPWAHRTLVALPFVVFYVGNWKAALHGGSDPLGALGHTWSLSVEEQFYLLWPLILLLVVRLVPDRRKIARGLFSAVVLIWVYRYVALHPLIGFDRQRVYDGTDTHADGLLLGCAVAFWLCSREDRRLAEPWQRLLSVGTVLSIVMLAYLMLRASLYSTSSAGLWLGTPLAVASTATILVGMVEAPVAAVSWFLRLRPMVWTGRRSYGIYLWLTAIQLMVIGDDLTTRRSYLFQALIAAVSVAVAALSYRFIEVPFLRIKERFSRTRAVVLPVPAGAHT